MSVGQAIMELQQEKENEMENKRYEMGGFYFGNKGVFQLTLKVKSERTADGTTSNAFEFGLELSPEERQELITLLITAQKEGI